ncbi:hypothetical protein BDV93DRAFT_575011 [Ceratobasidium sp. AG-I]|nr:hypothetical protein BDV93DRAFT_575011 [Ceratobasidium sp. AG-I]
MSLYPVTQRAPCGNANIRCFVYGSSDPSRDRFKVSIPWNDAEVCDLKDEIMHRAAITGEGPAYKLRLYKVTGVKTLEDGANINNFLPGTELIYPEVKISQYLPLNETYAGVVHIIVVLPSYKWSNQDILDVPG